MRNFICIRSLLLLITLLSSVLLTACSNTIDASEAYKGQSSQSIFAEGKTYLQSHNYSEAIKRFEALDVQYPDRPETQRAQLYLIYAYYMKEDYTLSVTAADRFIRLYPANENVDYAYYLRGIADYYQNMGVIERIFSLDAAKRDLTQIQKSYQDFNELVSRFPHSRYTPSAHQYMIYLRNVLADHEWQVADYYYQRKAYVAAANRASYIVAHYQGAPRVMDALVLMAKSYQQLGMTKLQQDTLKVIKYNNPNRVVTFD